MINNWDETCEVRSVEMHWKKGRSTVSKVVPININEGSFKYIGIRHVKGSISDHPFLKLIPNYYTNNTMYSLSMLDHIARHVILRILMFLDLGV